MTQRPDLPKALASVSAVYARVLRFVVNALLVVAGLGVLAMMVVTCLDVVMRVPWINRSLIGAYDIVKITGALTLAAALPYTTAVKGHVAVEFFFHRLGARGRVLVDTLTRLLGMGLFALLACRSWVRARDLGAIGQVTPTLQLPLCWSAYVLAAACAVVVLVILHNLMHPGKEMIKP